MRQDIEIGPTACGRRKDCLNVSGTLAGFVPLGDSPGDPIVERNGQCLLWPDTWHHKKCHIALDGYVVWPDSLMLGRSQDDMRRLGDAVLEDPVRWSREVKNGCFNIVIHDFLRQRTSFVSDRFGFLPLYIFHDATGCWFASDLESLRNIVPCQLALDKTGLAELYWFGYQIGDRTAYQGVRMMPAGTVLSLSWLDGSTTEECWVETSDLCEDDHCVSPKETPVRYVDLVTKACTRLYDPSLHYGITLSGGMDSRVISACWPDKRVCTYTWGDENSVEMKIAAKLAKRLALEHIEIPVLGDFFRAVHIQMFRKYGLMEFVSGMGIPFMLNNGTNVILDGILNDWLFASVRKCTETRSEKLRWTLGLPYDSTPITMSNEAIAEKIYANIQRADDCIAFIPACFRHEIDIQKTRILDDIALEINKLKRDGDSLDALVQKVKINNRVRRYVSLTCTLSRPQIQSCFPCLDTGLLKYANRIRFIDKANKRFLIRVYSEQLTHIRDVPPLMSLLPFYVPKQMHYYGRMSRYLLETISRKVLRFSQGRVRFRTMDAFQWAKWLATNSEFREGIIEYLADSQAVDQDLLSTSMKSASRCRAWIDARLMSAISYCAWYKPEYAGSAWKSEDTSGGKRSVESDHVSVSR